MARPKRKRPTRTTKLDEAAHERLGELNEALESQDMGPHVTDVDMLSALVLFISPEQLEGMVRGYWRYTKTLDAEQPGPEAEDGG